MIQAFGVLGTVLLLFILILIGPLCSIWGLNTLFPILAIPYTWKTWVAMILVAGFFKGDFKFKSKE